MNILITGAHGFIGKNLCEGLKNIKNDSDHSRPGLQIEEIFEYDLDTDPALLDSFCAETDFVFNLAGVVRPKDQAEFMDGNFGFASKLLASLKKHNNTCPVMLSSSIQAALIGRFADSEYGKSKLASEELFFSYEKDTGAKILVYRFPNVFGKWCRPNYNSAVTTFCYNIANDLPIIVYNRDTELELLYIDDLVQEMLDALEGRVHHCEFNGLDSMPDAEGRYCYVPTTYKATLGEITDLLNTFKEQSETSVMPEIPIGSFAKKLYSTYLSYLPEEKVSVPLKMNCD